MQCNRKVIRVSTVECHHLAALAIGEVDAIRISNFATPESCEFLAASILRSDLLGDYDNARLISRVGKSFFETETPESRKHYFAKSIQWIREMRELCEPMLTPIDKLRLALDEAWPSGATLASMEGDRLFAGLARIFKRGSFSEIHQDNLLWDAPHSNFSRELTAQFAANTYLKMPNNGGALNLWRTELSKEQYDQWKNEGSYGLNSCFLPPPDITLVPKVGELIIFNSRRPHEVTDGDGDRIAWSSFIGVRRRCDALTIWS